MRLGVSVPVVRGEHSVGANTRELYSAQKEAWQCGQVAGVLPSASELTKDSRLGLGHLSTAQRWRGEEGPGLGEGSVGLVYVQL